MSEGLFDVRTANEWMKSAAKNPVPRMLFGELWHEGELCVLFADTNLGKSLLAVQIGNSISKGESIPGFRLEANKQPVLYFDFELSSKQFQNRYSIDYSLDYEFDDNFIRVEMNTDNIEAGKSFDDQLIAELRRVITETQSRVLVIDNLTFLNDGTETAKEATPLMKRLKMLKREYSLSILVLAHTPKRDSSRPITVNDIMGSKQIANFMDASFTIGRSTQGENIRYIKQIKQRNTPQIYHEDNVCVCELVKPDNFVQFQFKGFGAEWQHLRAKDNSEREQAINRAKELKAQGKTVREISQELSIAVGTVQNYLHAV